nr:DBF4-type zinc finger-containing protein 2 homolog [Aegilops tauschii subsp. strangulata]
MSTRARATRCCARRARLRPRSPRPAAALLAAAHCCAPPPLAPHPCARLRCPMPPFPHAATDPCAPTPSPLLVRAPAPLLVRAPAPPPPTDAALCPLPRAPLRRLRWAWPPAPSCAERAQRPSARARSGACLARPARPLGPMTRGPTQNV